MSSKYSPQDPYVLVSTPSTTPVGFNVSILGTEIYNTTTRYRHREIAIPYQAKLNGTGIQQKTIFVRSSENVSVHAVSNFGAVASIFLVLPVSQLGTSYYVGSYTRKNLTRYFPGEYAITALHENTSVTIIPHRGRAYNVSLQSGDTYQYQDYHTNITGTKIEASKPIALVAGSICPYIPYQNSCCCDTIFEQMTPTKSWKLSGTYILAPFLGLTSGYTFRVVADDTTRVTVHSSSHDVVETLSRSITLNPSDAEFHEENIIGDSRHHVTTVTIEQGIERTVFVNSDVVITETTHSSRPVAGMVVQYMNGGSLDENNNGDPAMVVVPPIESYAHNVTFPVCNSDPNIVWRGYLYFINVIINCSYVDGLTLDETIPMKYWNTLTTYDGSMCIIRGNVTNGTHTVGHPNQDDDAKFTVLVYSYAGSESRLYSAGFNLNTGKSFFRG